MKKLALLSLAALTGLSACAQNPATGSAMFTTISREQERAIGERTAEQELKRHGLYKPTSNATRYVLNLCNKIYAVTEMQAEPVQCILLDSPAYNAWATPGYINVYRGILPYMNSEAELAAVIAHEAGHINARHVAQGATQEMMFGLLATGVGVAVAAKTNNSNAANLAYTAAALGAGAAVMSFGRAHEDEADGLATRYMEQAGYDKREAVNMVRGMQAYQAFDTQVEAAYNDGKIPSESLLGRLYASHPATEDRLEHVQSLAGQEPDGGVKLPAGVTPATPAADPVGRKRFLEAIQGLEFGPERKYGIAGATYIAVPAKQFLWKLPSGFYTSFTAGKNEEDAGEWRGVQPSTGIVFGATFTKLRAGMNPANALLEGFPEIKQGTLQKVMVGGQQGYTAMVKSSSKVFRILAAPSPEADALAIIVVRYPGAQSFAENDEAAMRTLSGSHTLTEARARYFNPLEVSAFTAAVGDTVAKRAAKLPTGALREEWFRALNHLAPGEELKPGHHYKTITDTNLSLL